MFKQLLLGSNHSPKNTHQKFSIIIFGGFFSEPALFC